MFFRVPSNVFPRGSVVILAGQPFVDAAERSGNGQSVTRAKRVNVEQPGSLVAAQVFSDFVPEDRGTLPTHRRRVVRGLAFSEGAGQDRQRGLGLLVGIRHHTHRMKAERIGEDERSAVRVRKKGREHGAVQTAEFIAHVLGRLFEIEGGMQDQIVVRCQPRHAQRMGGQHDQAERPTGKGLHFDRLAQRQRGIAAIRQQRGPGEHVVSHDVERLGPIIVNLCDTAVGSETLRHLATRRRGTAPDLSLTALGGDELRCLRPGARSSHLDAPTPDLPFSFRPLLFHFVNQGWTKDAKTLAPRPFRRSQEDEPLRIGRHTDRILGNGRDAVPLVEFDESFAERADLLADPARGLLRRVPEADDELLAFLRSDGLVPDHGHDGFGGHERVFVQHREVVVAEPALLFPARRVAHFAGNDLLLHVGHDGDSVIDGVLL